MFSIQSISNNLNHISEYVNEKEIKKKSSFRQYMQWYSALTSLDTIDDNTVHAVSPR